MMLDMNVGNKNSGREVGTNRKSRFDIAARKGADVFAHAEQTPGIIMERMGATSEATDARMKAAVKTNGMGNGSEVNAVFSTVAKTVKKIETRKKIDAREVEEFENAVEIIRKAVEKAENGARSQIVQKMVNDIRKKIAKPASRYGGNYMICYEAVNAAINALHGVSAAAHIDTPSTGRATKTRIIGM